MGSGFASSARASTPICPSCGVVAPIHDERCACCRQALGRPPVVAPDQGAVYWAAVRCTFPCRSCGFAAPLDGVVEHEAVDCGQCGALQKFDVTSWPEGIAFAQAVGDLGGPNPEGRFLSAHVYVGDTNPHALIGVTKTFAVREAAALRVEASPGFPVCTRCRRPLDVQLVAGAARSKCSGCGVTAEHRTPALFADPSQGVRAVISEVQRSDRRDAQVQAASPGVSALLCPQCGAGLRPAGGPTVECSYCKTVAFIPPRARPREGGQSVEASVFWIAFEGPSLERQKIETPVHVQVKDDRGAGAVVFGRGLAPLPGIELAPRAPGPDLRQWGLVLSLTATALGVGYLASTWLQAP